MALAGLFWHLLAQQHELTLKHKHGRHPWLGLWLDPFSGFHWLFGGSFDGRRHDDWTHALKKEPCHAEWPGHQVSMSTFKSFCANSLDLQPDFGSTSASATTKRQGGSLAGFRLIFDLLTYLAVRCAACESHRADFRSCKMQMQFNSMMQFIQSIGSENLR